MNRSIFALILGFAILFSACNSDKRQKVVIETEFGNMTAVLYDETPQHRDNFVKLAKEGFFDDLLFHRVIDGFMIQGGDPDSKGAPAGQRLGMGGPGYTVPAEFVDQHVHLRGALSAARTGGPSNPEKRSSGSQFYIVQGQPLPAAAFDSPRLKNKNYTAEQIQAYQEVGGRPDLDRDYTVFGMVIEGLDVIDKIAKVQKDGNNRPIQDVKMKVRVK